MKKLAFLFMIGIVILFTSCKKDRVDNPDTTPDTMEELQVPADFSWKTTKEIQLTVSAPSNGIVEVTNSQNIAYQKAYLTPGQSYIMAVTLPSYEKNIKIRFMGQEVLIELTGSTISHSF